MVRHPPGVLPGRELSMKTLIKETLKKTLTAYPILKANRIFHELSGLRDRLHSRPDPSRSSRPDLVEGLMRDGVVSVEGFATPEQVQACLGELEPHFEQARSGFHPSHYDVLPKDKKFYYRLVRVDELAPASAFFYKSPLIWDVVRAYMSPRAESYRREAELRCDLKTEVSAEDLFHFDTWHPNVKAFLYLNDVDAGSGPFRYLAGSHRKAAWRRKREIEFDSDGWDGSWGHYFPTEVDHLKRIHGFEERVFTAKAGTLIIGDYRGLHRGTPLQPGGRRVLLNQVFNILDWTF
jgi:hypothetical protein